MKLTPFLSRLRMHLDRCTHAIQKTRNEQSYETALQCAPLEARMMMSATPLAIVANALDSAETANAADAGSADSTAANSDSANDSFSQNATSAQTAELVIVDTSAENYQQLIDDIVNNADETRSFQVFTFDPDRDGIEQITEMLSDYRDIDAIHIVSHGTDGNVRLGNATLNMNSLAAYAGQLGAWGDSLSSDGDILVYGCDLAESHQGEELVEALGVLTGADIAASDDLTGHASLGGDWDLEFVAGVVETDVAFSVTVQQEWVGLLVAPTITPIADQAVDEETSTGALAFTVADVDTPIGSLIVTATSTDQVKIPNGNLTLNDLGGGNWTISATPALDQVGGPVTITVTVDDGAVSTDEVFTVTINNVNDAPELQTFRDLVFDDVVSTMPASTNDGESVFELLRSDAGSPIEDEDTGSVEGIAINQIDDSNGTWEYSTDDGSNWIAIDTDGTGAFTVANSNALLLTADVGELNRVRFNPTSGYVGSGGIFKFRAWDTTETPVVGNGSYADIDTLGVGGANAFSTNEETATINVVLNSYLLDQFNTVGDYSGNDGTHDFVTSWDEIDNGSAGTAGGGNIRVVAPGELRFKASNGDDYFSRKADLSGAVTATLTYNFTNNGFTSGYVNVQARTGSTGPWTTIDTINSSTPLGVSAPIDLTPHIAADTEIRFFVPAAGTEVGVNLRFDDIRIEYAAAPTAQTVVVTTTNDLVNGNTTSIANLILSDGGDGISLREAIFAANLTPNGATPDRINFDIPDSDAGHYYYRDDGTPGSLSLVATTVLDDSSILDFDPDYPVTPFSWFRINLDPLAADEPTISEAVIIDGYSQSGSSANTLAVGSDAILRIEVTSTGADNDRGLTIDANGDNTQIRGLVINDFDFSAIATEDGADGVVIQGNFIGTDVTGTLGMGNSDNGVQLWSNNNVVGGGNSADRNVIAGNAFRGITTFSGGTLTGNVIRNNYIGVDASGQIGLGNGTAGIQLYNVDGIQIIDNVIADNGADGIWFRQNTQNAVVENNLIGVAADGTTLLGNSGNGILFEGGSNDNVIGSAGKGNVIADNVSAGIHVVSGTRNTFTENDIYANGGLGISLDPGTNTDQAAPVLSDVVRSGPFVSVHGDYTDAADSGDTVIFEFFATPSGGPGEGRRYLGSRTMTLDGAGFTDLDVVLNVAVDPTDTLTVTATDSSGNTSGFSNSVLVQVADTALWFETNGPTTGTGAAPIGWDSNNIVAFNDPNLSFGEGTTNGTFSVPIGFQPTEPLRGIHYVDNDVTVAGYPLLEGDLLLVFNITPTPVTIGGVTDVLRDDVMLFRPGAGMDYTNGTYTKFLDDPIKDGGTPKNIHAISFVEKDTVITPGPGGTTLSAGTFIIARAKFAGTDDHEDIFTFTPTSVGAGSTSGTTSLLLSGADLGFATEQVQGLELIEESVVLGGVTLNTGDLLVALNNTVTVAGTVTANSTDIVHLQISATEQDATPATAATATMLFDGSDVGLDHLDANERINGITIINSVTLAASQPPVVVHNGPHTISEGDGVSLSAVGSTDPDGDPMTYDWDIDNDGTYDIINVISPSLTWAQLQGYGINEGDVGGLNYDIKLRVNDDQGTSTVVTTQITVNDVPPDITVTGSGAVGEGAVYTINLSATDDGTDVISNWFIDWGDGSFDTSAVNTATHSYTVGGFHNIVVMAQDGDGLWHDAELLVPSWGTDTVHKVDSNTGQITTTFSAPNPFDRPVVAMSGPGGEVFVNVYGSDRIAVFDSNSVHLRTFNLPPGSGPSDLAFSPIGELVVSNYLSSNLSFRDPATGTELYNVSLPGQPGGIAYDENGVLYISSYDTGEILRYDAGNVSVIETGLDTPDGLVIGPDGNLYVAARGSDTVEVRTTAGGFVRSFSVSNPNGVAFTPDGKLLVSRQGGADDVRTYDPVSGAYLGDFVPSDPSLDDPYYLNFAASHQVTVANEVDPPSVSGSSTNEEVQTTSGLVVTKHSSDGSEIRYVKVTSISNGTLFKNDGTTSIADGTFVTYAEANAGLKFTPTTDFVGNATFDVQVSTHNDNSNLSTAVTATIAVGNINDAPGGTVTITGTPTEDQVLTASNTLTDVDGLGTIAYQWQRNGSDIVGETGTTYTLDDIDVGKNIRVVASYADGQSFNESVNSPAVGPIVAVNDAPGGSVSITGTPTENQVLTASNTLTDVDGLGTIAYQWQRNGSDIVGETDTTYTLDDIDVGQNIRVVASYTDGQSFNESVNSVAVGPIAAVNDAPGGSVSITGTPTEDQVLTASNTLTDVDGLAPVSYQWQRNGIDIVGETAITYTLVDADVGRNIRVVASYTDGQGFNESVNSPSVGPVANVNDAPGGGVNISGSPAEGSTLTANQTLTDDDGLGTVGYQWQRNGVNISGATGATYVLAPIDSGQMVRVVASYTDAQGTSESVNSAAVGPITNSNNSPTGTVTISGILAEDQTLTAANTLADLDGLGPITYQWQRGGADITGATSTTYSLTDADVGYLINVVASYTDGGSTPESVSSTTVGPVTNVNDAPGGSVNISGVPTEDQLLTASNTLTDADGTGTVSYQWQRNGSDISGATATTYLLGDADSGQNIRVVASYTDGQGTSESVASATIGPITNLNDPPIGTVTISGLAQEDQTLTGSNTLADADGLGPFTCQWQRDGVDIVGETGMSYTLTQADVGAVITMVVGYTDGQGTAESVTSNSLGPVANVNDAPAGAVSMSGSPSEGSTLTAANTIADDDGLGPISYQWKRNGVDITGAISVTYLLAPVDVGSLMTVEASYTDGYGMNEAVLSTAVGPVTNVNNVPTGSVTISGIATEDETLTASDTLADADGLGPITYHWLRDGVHTGATGSSYVLGDADVGTLITVDAHYTDGGATNEIVVSTAVGAIANINDDPTITAIGDVIIAEDGATGSLAFSVSDIETAAGLLTVTASSSDTTLIPNASVVLNDLGGGNWTISAAGAIDQHGGPATITVSVNDGTSTVFETFDITINPVNDAPIISTVAAQNITEDVAVGATLITISATDVDTADTLSYALIAGNTDGAFTISATGEITVAAPLDFATTPAYMLTVEVYDSGAPALNDTISVSITVTQVIAPAPVASSADEPSVTESDSDHESEVIETAMQAPAGLDSETQTVTTSQGQASTADSTTADDGIVGVVTAVVEDAEAVFIETAIKTYLVNVVQSDVATAGSSGLARGSVVTQTRNNTTMEFATSDFSDDLFKMRGELNQTAGRQFYAAASAVGATGSLTVGYVLWALRGGWLVSSILAQMPAWQLVDPLMVLSSLTGDDELEDDQSLQDMLRNGVKETPDSLELETTP